MRNWGTVRLNSLPKISQLAWYLLQWVLCLRDPGGPWTQHCPTQPCKGGSRFPQECFPPGISVRSVLSPKSTSSCISSLLPSPSLVMTNFPFITPPLHPLQMNFCWWLFLDLEDPLKQKIVTKETFPGTASGLPCVPGGRTVGSILSLITFYLWLSGDTARWAEEACCDTAAFPWKCSAQLAKENLSLPLLPGPSTE